MDWQKILFNSGDLFLPSAVKAFLETYWIGNDTSIFYVTWWTVIHVVSGLLIGIYLKGSAHYYLYGFVIHSAWELWQILGKNTKYWTSRGQMDVLVDTVAFMGGMAAIKTN
jgi:hypothetical protein